MMKLKWASLACAVPIAAVLAYAGLHTTPDVTTHLVRASIRWLASPLLQTVGNVPTACPHVVAAEPVAPSLKMPVVPLWSTVIEDRLLAYSAHWELRDTHNHPAPYVKIIMSSLEDPSGSEKVVDVYDREGLGCVFAYADGSHVDGAASIIHTFTGRKENRYFFLGCSLENTTALDVKRIPTAVKVHCRRCSALWQMEIEGMEHLQQFLQGSKSLESLALPTHELAICVKQTFGPYDDPEQLTQWLAYYHTMGASQVTLYGGPRAFSDRAMRVLRRASELGMSIQLLQWNFDYHFVHENGQVAAHLDCLHRNMHSAKFSVYVDFDELIAPRQHASLPDMLGALTSKHPDAAAFVFRHHQMVEGGDEASGKQVTLPLMMFNWRLAYDPLKPPSRTKYVVLGQRLVHLGIHHPQKGTLNDAPVRYISPEYAGMFHYRYHKVGVKGESAPHEEDVMLRFHDRMAKSEFVKGLLELDA